MNKKSTYTIWKSHPTGNIAKGAFCETCARYNARNSTVEIIVLDSAGKILLIKRATEPQQGWWALPGGYVDWGETLAEAAKRETEEETGLHVDGVRFFRLFDDPARDLDGRENIGHCFVATAHGELKRDEQETSAAAWFALDALPEHIAFDHKKMIEEYDQHTQKEHI